MTNKEIMKMFLSYVTLSNAQLDWILSGAWRETNSKKAEEKIRKWREENFGDDFKRRDREEDERDSL